MSASLILKDKKIRKRVALLESKFKLYKYLLREKGICVEKKKQIARLLYNSGRNWSISHIQNRCVLTGRTRGLVKDYKVSRLVFKKLIVGGYLSGGKKSSW